jgi:hypothetical protein
VVVIQLLVEIAAAHGPLEVAAVGVALADICAGESADGRASSGRAGRVDVPVIPGLSASLVGEWLVGILQARMVAAAVPAIEFAHTPWGRPAFKLTGAPSPTSAVHFVQ